MKKTGATTIFAPVFLCDKFLFQQAKNITIFSGKSSPLFKRGTEGGVLKDLVYNVIFEINPNSAIEKKDFIKLLFSVC